MIIKRSPAAPIPAARNRLCTTRATAMLVLGLALAPCAGAGAASAAAGVGRPDLRPVAEELEASREVVILAEAIVRGAVVQADSYWSPDRTMIYTTYRIRVDAVISGAADSIIAVTAQGGTVGDTTLRVSGSADMVPGLPYLFLLGDEPGYLCILGGARGAFILSAADSREKGFDTMIAEVVRGIRGEGRHDVR